MAEMVLGTFDIRIRLSKSDFADLVMGDEVTLEGDYNIMRGNKRLIKITLQDMTFSTMLQAVTAALKDEEDRE